MLDQLLLTNTITLSLKCCNFLVTTHLNALRPTFKMLLKIYCCTLMSFTISEKITMKERDSFSLEIYQLPIAL